MNRFDFIERIEREQFRAVLYLRNNTRHNFHVIAKKDESVVVGDEIEYEPYCFNFGYFVKKVTEDEEEIARLKALGTRRSHCGSESR